MFRYQMQNQPNHKGSIGDFARSALTMALTQCNLIFLEASLDPEHRDIATSRNRIGS